MSKVVLDYLNSVSIPLQKINDGKDTFRCNGLIKDVNEWKNLLSSPYNIVMERKRLSDYTGGIAVPLVVLLQAAWEIYLKSERSLLIAVLQLHLSIAQMDSTLAEEMAYVGSHVYLSKILHHTPVLNNEDEEDLWMETQDLACEISICSNNFPMKFSPLTQDELKARLPLSFTISPLSSAETKLSDQTIYIHQVTKRQSAQEDVGFVMWPSAAVLSKFILSYPDWILGGDKNVKNWSILELGSGCGLTGLVAAKIVSEERKCSENDNTMVWLSDFNPIVVENIQRNLLLNQIPTNVAKSLPFDFYQSPPSELQNSVNVILAADVICKVEDAVAVAQTIHSTLTPGGIAIAVSANAKHRFGVDHFEYQCKSVGLFIQSSNISPEFLSDCGIQQTSGYVENMTLTMFKITKPNPI